jgi:hypothetical protein
MTRIAHCCLEQGKASGSPELIVIGRATLAVCGAISSVLYSNLAHSDFARKPTLEGSAFDIIARAQGSVNHSPHPRAVPEPVGLSVLGA